MVKVTVSSFGPSPLTSLFLAASFLLRRVTITVIGCRLYDYYDLICNPLVHTSPSLVRLGNLMAQFHSSHTNGSSPGKNVISFTPRLPSIPNQLLRKGFWTSVVEGTSSADQACKGSLSFSRELRLGLPSDSSLDDLHRSPGLSGQHTPFSSDTLVSV